MYNYKFFFRSILVITFLLLIISPGCTFWAKANYRQFGREGFDELKKINEVPEYYGSSLGNLDKNNVGQYIVLISIIEEHYKNANESFERMEGYAITNNEKELASSLANYTDYMARAMGKFREMLEFMNKYNAWDNYTPNDYLTSEAQKIKTEMETYFSLSSLEMKKAEVLLDRMPEYQKYFADLYELGTVQEQKDKSSSTREKNFNIIWDNIIFYLICAFIFFIFIIMPSGIAYYLVRKKSNRSEKFLNSILVGPGLLITFAWIMLVLLGNFSLPLILISIPFLLLGILCLMAYGLYCKDLTFKLKKKNKSDVDANNIKLIINPDKQHNSLEYLKSFDKLSEKEIVTFLYLRNNSEVSRDKLIEMFGDETISSLIAKGHFREENVDQN